MTSSPSRSPTRSYAPGSPLSCAAPSAAATAGRLHFGPLTIDLAARQVRLGQEPIELAAKEYELLVALTSDPHRVLTREELLRNVWGYRTPSRTVDSHACRLRQRLSAHPQRLVINVWGVGYRFCDPVGPPQTTIAEAAR